MRKLAKSPRRGVDSLPEKVKSQSEPKGNAPRGVELESATEQEPESSLGQELKDVLGVIWLSDLFEVCSPIFHRGPAISEQVAVPTIAEEEFDPQPSAIPFGPFLAIGFLATVFIGELLTAAYLAYALPKPMP